jgi:protein phosphatase
MLKAVGITHEGLKRDHNEDSILVNTRVGFFAVADGMGGHSFGETASRMAVQVLNAHIESALNIVRKRTVFDRDMPENLLYEAVDAANSYIYEFSRCLCSENTGNNVMGTTLSATLIVKEKLFTAHVGDSRIYRFRKSTLERLTRDHSETQELIDAGILDEKEAEQHPSSHVLTQAVGANASVTPDLLVCQVAKGDQFLIASDGLFRVLEEKLVLDTLCLRGTLREKSRRLVTRALDGGVPDNISVIIVEPSGNGFFGRIFLPR